MLDKFNDKPKRYEYYLNNVLNEYTKDPYIKPQYVLGRELARMKERVKVKRKLE